VQNSQPAALSGLHDRLCLVHGTYGNLCCRWRGPGLDHNPSSSSCAAPRDAPMEERELNATRCRRLYLRPAGIVRASGRPRCGSARHSASGTGGARRSVDGTRENWDDRRLAGGVAGPVMATTPRNWFTCVTLVCCFPRRPSRRELDDPRRSPRRRAISVGSGLKSPGPACKHPDALRRGARRTREPLRLASGPLANPPSAPPIPSGAR